MSSTRAVLPRPKVVLPHEVPDPLPVLLPMWQDRMTTYKEADRWHALSRKMAKRGLTDRATRVLAKARSVEHVADQQWRGSVRRALPLGSQVIKLTRLYSTVRVAQPGTIFYRLFEFVPRYNKWGGGHELRYSAADKQLTERWAMAEALDTEAMQALAQAAALELEAIETGAADMPAEAVALRERHNTLAAQAEKLRGSPKRTP